MKCKKCIGTDMGKSYRILILEGCPVGGELYTCELHKGGGGVRVLREDRHDRERVSRRSGELRAASDPGRLFRARL
jgi:hypothetical protein